MDVVKFCNSKSGKGRVSFYLWAGLNLDFGQAFRLNSNSTTLILQLQPEKFNMLFE